ncbi:MAG: metallophosphoesterase [Prolixibacteraceae bacterium]|nr:metallophosphoesterase [Prolixibacteraceae bacterium]
MKNILLLLLLLSPGIKLLSQNDSILKIIFIPHPRSEDKVNQSVAKGIENIDFNLFDVKMLGGDLTYYTSDERATMEYCDRLFDLDNLNTLWAFGNHDVQSNNLALIKEFTGRERYYSYFRDGITFIVLDTEINAEGFDRTFIKDDQLKMIKNVCDTINISKHLILLHHRLIWMINNDELENRLTDSIAASSRSMDTTNFYSDIYPLLKDVKSKGIQVSVFGGDKSKINIEYSPEDSITFYAARLASDFSDDLNNVIVLNYNKINSSMESNFVPLNSLKKTTNSSDLVKRRELEKIPLIIERKGNEVSIQVSEIYKNESILNIYNINGCLLYSKDTQYLQDFNFKLDFPGLYIVQLTGRSSTVIQKISF